VKFLLNNLCRLTVFSSIFFNYNDSKLVFEILLSVLALHFISTDSLFMFYDKERKTLSTAREVL
jgi:hypothetical protein